ncbi:helix-turn-helix transcriptional regulator [Streptomyces sp. DSM 3412]|uniref:Helix-turn-helix transcriptional regulator n=1 Tax=Streptomyces gottesmaniae TaxID=3075518 RepID=A0ABU2YXL0_9ACTN|nr:helix-turn-helix transcriptional regulator [Streptomyces sp. DSM 3412]MDT0567932.1 helix-turn-helix transcriptional regulator [Streptomyces sp. DSM 3412]
MPDTTAHTSVGDRVREFRLIRDYSLTQLSTRSNVSRSMISMVETGDRAASPAIVGALARALGVTVSVLHGQPYVQMLQADQLDALLGPITSALDSWDIPPDDDLPPRTLDEIATTTTQVARQRAAGEFSAVAEALPELISVLSVAAQDAAPGRDRERAHNMLAEVSRTTAIVAYRLGYMGLARQALARMAASAPHSGDPRQVAVERYERAVMTHAETARPDRGVALVRQALRDLDDDGEPSTMAVRGTLLLRASALSAASEDHSAAGDWLGEARELAEAGAAADAAAELPGARYALAFGNLNVKLGELDMAIYRDDHEQAVRVASEVRWPDNYQPTRVAGFLIRRAAAEAWTARGKEALKSLQEARDLAPMLTRYHPEVHETVGTLLRARQRAGEDLRQFAEWSGV